MRTEQVDVAVRGLGPGGEEVAGMRTEAGLSVVGAGQVTFTVGDAEQLSYPDTVSDGFVCACAFCTFPDKPTAAAGLAPVLRPGGWVGITDVVADPARLPGELTGLLGYRLLVADKPRGR